MKIDVASILIHLTVFVHCGGGITIEEYFRDRDELLQSEDYLLLGSSIQLTPQESQVNGILMGFKNAEFAHGLATRGREFPASKHFFLAKPLIERSQVYKIIRMLPKGASLHLHEATAANIDFIVNNLTSWSNWYYCNDSKGGQLNLRFFDPVPDSRCSETGGEWKSGQLFLSQNKEIRRSIMFESMSMFTNEPHVNYPDGDTAWTAFETKIATMRGLARYWKAMKAVYLQVLQEHLEDNVMYVEMRGFLEPAYHLNQTVLTKLEALRIYKEATSEFVHSHPEFWGGKYIYAPLRNYSPEETQKIINDAFEMKATFPNYFAGFDLVGQEDTGTPLKDFIPLLLAAKEKNISFFFHAGETNWLGTKIDENLVDAVLLNTTRLGHSFALLGYPNLLKIAKEKNIPVEICPLSNQILGLVKDLRNHPSKLYIRDGFPIVIASDGPGIWGATPLSHDWYMTFMAIAGKRADLRFLKQVALNSIKYSAMSDGEKLEALSRWGKSWTEFLDKVLKMYGQGS